MEVRSIEEYIRGPEGDEEKGLLPRLRDIWADAQSDEIDKIQIECRTISLGTTSSRQEFVARFLTKHPPSEVVNALRKRLESSPSDTFSGTIRLLFKPAGKSDHLGSFQRKMRPAISPAGGPTGDESGLALPGDLQRAAAYFTSLIKPQQEMNLRLISECAVVVRAAGEVVAASKGPAQTGQQSGGMVGDLLRGAMLMGQAEHNARAGAQGGSGGGAPAGPVPAGGTLAPPGPPGMPRPVSAPPAPGSYDDSVPELPGPHGRTPQIQGPVQGNRIGRADVEKWATENEAEATAMVMGLLRQRGLTVVPG